MNSDGPNQSRRFRIWRVTICLGLVIVVSAVVIIGNAIRTRQLTWESVLHLIGCVSNAESANIQDIVRIRQYLSSLEFYNVEPPQQFRDIFRPEVVGANLLNDKESHLLSQNILAGVDRFGTPYVYEVRLFDQHDSRYVRYQITIRSVGANGRDEAGAGDDVQRIVDIGHDCGEPVSF